MSKSLCDKTIQVLAGYLAKACRSENYCNYIILLKGNLPPSLPRISGLIFIKTETSNYMSKQDPTDFGMSADKKKIPNEL